MDSESLKPTAAKEHEISNAHSTEQDEAAMAEVGKVQQFQRNFGFWTILGLTASMMATWEAVLIANFTAMLNGGTSTLVYGFIYAFLGALSTAASLAELASIFPTSGGQYHFTAALAPPSQKVFLSWFCGWIATLGWIANTAVGAFFVATMIQGVLAQNDPSYDYHRWHGTLLMFAVMLLVFLVNSIGTKLFSLIEGAAFVFHVCGFVGIIVPLLYFSRHGTSKEVWATFTDSAGWGSNGLAWWVGLISSNLPLIGYDGPIHLAEEVRNASTVVPWAMIWTVTINGLLGWAISIAFSYSIIPTFGQALKSPTGYDFIEVFYAAAGKAGVAGMTSVLIILVWFATFGFLATASRQTWAFARDRGLPFSDYFAKVNKTLALPLRAIVLCSKYTLTYSSLGGIIPCLLGLINIGSTVAFNAIVSLTEAGLFTSYLIPIMLIMIKKIKGEDVKYGPFRLGKIGIAVNAFSSIFLVLSTFFSFFPPATPVTSVSMNWSCAVFGGFVIIGFVWYGIYGRKQYNGPIVERPLLDSDESKGM